MIGHKFKGIVLTFLEIRFRAKSWLNERIDTTLPAAGQLSLAEGLETGLNS